MAPEPTDAALVDAERRRASDEDESAACLSISARTTVVVSSDEYERYRRFCDATHPAVDDDEDAALAPSPS